MDMFKFFSALVVPAVFTLSCVTTPVGIVPSNIPLNDKKVSENLGRVKSSDTAVSILGIWMVGRPDFDKAIKESIALKNGDALINISIYETYTYFILFSLTKVSVEGDAVKLAPLAEKKEEKKK